MTGDLELKVLKDFVKKNLLNISRNFSKKFITIALGTTRNNSIILRIYVLFISINY